MAVTFEPRGIEGQVGSPGQVDYHLRQAFIHRHQGMSVTLDPHPLAQGLSECLTEGDAGILHQVMDIHLQITSTLDGESKAAVPDQLLEQVIQETMPTGDLPPTFFV